ncbi:DNA-binding protein WhiA [Mycolicibacterium fortuitum]|uniref:DNA-binding protein WhiA n=1 Tax=Mycolicibacterium TaxID=1866885 RepID=UPI00320469FC
MNPTISLIAELVATPVEGAEAARSRRAEAAAALRAGGGLRMQHGRLTLESRMSSEAAAVRIARVLTDLFECTPRIDAGPRRTATLRVSDADALARRLGLLDVRGRPVVGMPAALVSAACASDVIAAAALRGAMLSTGHLRVASVRPPTLQLRCPGPAAALAVAGFARRLSAIAEARQGSEVDGAIDYVRVRYGVGALLEQLGAKEAAKRWDDAKAVAAAQSRLDTRPLSKANSARAAQAGLHIADKVRLALEILGSDVPPEWICAAQMRIAHPEASNTDLAGRCTPPMTKHTFAGRLRRLVSAAEQRVLDIPA